MIWSNKTSKSTHWKDYCTIYRTNYTLRKINSNVWREIQCDKRIAQKEHTHKPFPAPRSDVFLYTISHRTKVTPHKRKYWNKSNWVSERFTLSNYTSVNHNLHLHQYHQRNHHQTTAPKYTKMEERNTKVKQFWKRRLLTPFSWK